MPINLPKSSEQNIKELLEKNLELSQDMHKMVKSIKNYVIGQRIWFVIKLLIIAIPLIVGFIYLPPLLKDLFVQYKELLGGVSGASSNLESLFKESGSLEAPEEYKRLLK
ncbi:MAG: hypothetical protein ABIE43_02360 [Patescibacteria group bacterium]